jgi:hypothetical protein
MTTTLVAVTRADHGGRVRATLLLDAMATQFLIPSRADLVTVVNNQ